MPLTVRCECGRELPVSLQQAGMSLTCQCGRTLAVGSLSELRRRALAAEATEAAETSDRGLVPEPPAADQPVAAAPPRATRWSSGQWALLSLLVAVHLSFYISALGGDFYRRVYPQGEIQDNKYLDYWQVPNGAKTLFEGGDLMVHGARTVGARRPYPVLPNVYHPLFTLVVGGVLQLFSMQTGFVIFALFKLAVTIAFLRMLVVRYRGHEHLLFAIFVLLCQFSQSVEIGTGQYHFLLNACIFLFLWGTVVGRHDIYLSIWQGLSLFVKPIALLWTPLLLMRSMFWVALLPVGVFVAATIVYYAVTNETPFYLMNLFTMSASTMVRDTLPRYSVSGILMFFGAGAATVTLIKYAFLLVLLAVSYRMRDVLLLGITVWICYFLLFYSLVYEYHYTSLIPVLVLGVLACREFQDWFAKLLMVWICLPPPMLLFHALGLFPYVPGQWSREIGSDAVDVSRNLSDAGMLVLMVFKVLPVLVLMIYIVLRREYLAKQRAV